MHRGIVHIPMRAIFRHRSVLVFSSFRLFEFIERIGFEQKYVTTIFIKHPSNRLELNVTCIELNDESKNDASQSNL